MCCAASAPFPAWWSWFPFRSSHRRWQVPWPRFPCRGHTVPFVCWRGDHCIGELFYSRPLRNRYSLASLASPYNLYWWYLAPESVSPVPRYYGSLAYNLLLIAGKGPLSFFPAAFGRIWWWGTFGSNWPLLVPLRSVDTLRKGSYINNLGAYPPLSLAYRLFVPSFPEVPLLPFRYLLLLHFSPGSWCFVASPYKVRSTYAYLPDRWCLVAVQSLGQVSR